MKNYHLRPMKIREHLGLLFALGLFIFLFLHHNWGRMDGIDAHIFTAMGFHVAEGQQLYVDVWESKPINIYILNALAFKIFGVQYSSIWLIQLINGFFACFLVYRLTSFWTKDKHLALISSLFFMWLFYFSGLYYSGNCTEEFGVTFLLAGIFFMVKSWAVPSRSKLLLSGAMLSMAFWFKEPFLFSMLPWLTWHFIQLIRKRSWKWIAFSLLGLAIPFVLYLGYFLLSGSIDEVFKIFIYNQEYTAFMGLEFSEKISKGWEYLITYLQYRFTIVPYLVLLIVPALVLARRQKQISSILILLLCQALLEILSISLSGLTVTHYYLQILPTLVLIIMVSLHAILNRLSFRPRLIVKGVLIGLILNAIFNIELKDSPRLDRYDEIKAYFDANKSEEDRLFVENAWHGALYVINKMKSDATIPTPLFHYFMIQDKYNHERVEKFVRSLRSKPPRYIVVSKERGILKNHTELNSWFYMIYQKGKSFKAGNDVLTIYELSLP